mgnify:CR=1 FL=1
MRIKKLKIKTKTQTYPIIIGSDILTNFSRLLKSNSINFQKCLLVVDKNVPKKVFNKAKRSLKKKRNLYSRH